MNLHSLKTKTAVTVSMLVVILITAIASFILSYFEANLKETIATQEFTLVAGMAKEVDNKLDIAHGSLIATSKTIDPAVLADHDKAQAFLDAQAGIKTIFDNHIFIFSPAGDIIAESPFVPDRRGRNFAHREYIKKTLELGKPYIGAPYRSSQDHGHPAIMLTAPVYDTDGKLIAILAGGLDLMKDNFLGSIAKTKLGQNGYVYIYDTNRTIIIHPDTTRTLKRDVPPGANKYFDLAIEGFEGSAETVNSRGIHQLATFKRLGSTNWIFVANHPVDEIYEPITKARKYIVAANVVGILVLLLGIWYLVGHFTAPLLAFTRHVENLGDKQGEGRFSTIFPNDEIGALSKAFNTMLNELDRKTASLEKSEELYRTLTEFASDMVFWRGPAGNMYYISPNCERLTGYRDSDFYAHPRLLDDIVYHADMASWMAYTGGENGAVSGAIEFRIVAKDGSIRWVVCVTRPVYNEKKEYCGLRGSLQDITIRKHAEERLHYVSLHDSLTGFKNRASFENELGTFARAECLPVSVVVCDVDGLKFVNDTLGHTAGDQLLTAVAGILKKHFAADAAIYRIGGDEFVIILPSTDLTAAEKTCQDLQKKIASYNADTEMTVNVSVGFASSNGDSADMVSLLKEADDNMYREKLNRSQSTRGTTLSALTQAVGVRDFDIVGHAAHVQNLVTLLGEKIGLSERSLADLRLLAQFHDIGKIGVPENILFKTGPLTTKERHAIERHAEIGYRIAISTPDLAPIADLILNHHEWWDGNGYPLRLKGEQIPLACRILAIADAYDAMTSDRPYRAAVTSAQALAEIERCAGTQFDPSLAKTFINAMTGDLLAAD